MKLLSLNDYFLVTDSLARLGCVLGLLGLIFIPFDPLKESYYAYKGWNPIWLGLVYDLFQTVVIFVVCYFYLRRKLLVTLGGMFILLVPLLFSLQIFAVLILIGFYIFMLIPFLIVLRQKDGRAV